MKTDTLILVKAMRRLADDIQSDDGVANAAISEAADRLAELERENAALREALDTLTHVIGLTPIAGNKAALQEAFDMARAALRKESQP